MKAIDSLKMADELKKIDKHLLWDENQDLWKLSLDGNARIYHNGMFTNNFQKLLPQEMAAILHTLTKYGLPVGRFQIELATPADPQNFKSKDNSFRKYTDQLAATLYSKNLAYGNSFAKSLDEDGLLVAKIRIGDKFNRLSHLIKNKEFKENDGSLNDTLKDLAGYAILTLNYLKEHKHENFEN